MSVLNSAEIKKRIREKKDLLITPLLSEDQIGPASVDIRLGCSIIVPRRTYVEGQDVTDPALVKQVERHRYERVRLKYHQKFVLHPNELILGATFEYLVLPADICCSIASRSSWGRLGLIIATASVVQPGFKGCLTLELVNVSESPIVLYPGLLVGQLVLFEVPARGASGSEYPTYQGRYDCPTEAGLPAFFNRDTDKEMEFWREGLKSPETPGENVR